MANKLVLREPIEWRWAGDWQTSHNYFAYLHGSPMPLIGIHCREHENLLISAIISVEKEPRVASFQEAIKRCEQMILEFANKLFTIQADE